METLIGEPSASFGKGNGVPWPKEPNGRNFDVAHKRALADGGDNSLDNFLPMPHKSTSTCIRRNGDFARWAKRRWDPK